MLDLVLDGADGAGISWLHRNTEVLAKAVRDDGSVAMTVRATTTKAATVRAKFAPGSEQAPQAREDDMRRQTPATLVAAAVVAVAALIALSFVGSAAAQDTLRFGKIPSTVRNVGSLYLFMSPSARASLRASGLRSQSVLIEGGTDRMVAALTPARSTSPTRPRPT